MLERLEQRRLLAAAIEGGVLVARGSDANNTIKLRRSQTDDVVVTIWQGSATPASQQTFDMDNFNGVLLDGLGGNDQLYYAGDRIVPGVTMTGGEGNDWLYGAFQSNAAESLLGGNGNDTLTGNGGPDTLLGGDGDDLIRYDGADGTDSVDGEVGLDSILAPGASATFAKASAGILTLDATDGDDQIETRGVFESSDLDVFRVSLNGSSREFDRSQVNSATLNGLGGDDQFDLRFSSYGEFDRNPELTFFGGAGNDYFRAAEGQTVATVFGGDGDDTVQALDIASQWGFASGGSGIDTIVLEQAPIDLRAHPDVENAVNHTGDIYGNALDNRLTNISSGYISAGEGNDTLVGGHDSTDLYGDGGNDLLFVSGFASREVDGGAGIDTVSGTASVERLLNVEVVPPPTVVLANRRLDVFGSYRADVVELRRVGFDDVEISVKVDGESTPSLHQTFDLDEFDSVTVFGNTGNDTLFVANGAAIPGLHLFGGSGSDTIIGSSLDDFLAGNSGRDELFGIAGDDLLAGDLFDAAESDTIDGGSGNDKAFADDLDVVTNVEDIEPRY